MSPAIVNSAARYWSACILKSYYYYEDYKTLGLGEDNSGNSEFTRKRREEGITVKQILVLPDLREEFSEGTRQAHSEVTSAIRTILDFTL